MSFGFYRVTQRLCAKGIVNCLSKAPLSKVFYVSKKDLDRQVVGEMMTRCKRVACYCESNVERKVFCYCCYDEDGKMVR